MLTAIIAWLFILGPCLKSQRDLRPPCNSKTGFSRAPFLPSTRLFPEVSVRAAEDEVHENYEDTSAQHPSFRVLLEATSLPEKTRDDIVSNLIDVGLLLDKNSGTENLVLIAQDFVDRPEVFSSLLMSDFGLPPLVAHQTRAVVMGELSSESKDVGQGETMNAISERGEKEKHLSNAAPLVGIPIVDPDTKGNPPKQNTIDQGVSAIKLEISPEIAEPVKRAPYKSVIVNKQASLRRSKQTSSEDTSHDYGLPSDYKTRFPTIAGELEDFSTFMTRPATSSQDEPIRPATAVVYVRHARQFLGWYAATYNITNGSQKELSVYKLFPNKDKSSADSVLEFILWLRSHRNISVSYEANILRGLTKFLKFRFAKESQSDPSYGEKSFDDIPLVREIRRLHRDANKRQRLAPRSSDESQKWLSWPEYLQVVQSIRRELLGHLEQHGDKSLLSETSSQINLNDDNETSNPLKKVKTGEVATIFQRYLILAIFSSVPDRQRTIRELEIGRTFQKNEASGCWCIKHAPDDYKTGKSYGERPLLQLSAELTPWIDKFLEQWRQCLNPRSDSLFVQPRTGKPLTQDSVYQIVTRACYKYTGKKTNPHLLRDMLVTHVRESDASEKQLEALALYMGHSIEMQRSSYDRRTLTTKVAPAVELLQSVNDGVNGNRMN